MPKPAPGQSPLYKGTADCFMRTINKEVNKFAYYPLTWISQRICGKRKRYPQSTNADQKSIETVFFIAICRPTGDKWQSKRLFLLVFDLRSSIVLTFLIAAYPVWI